MSIVFNVSSVSADNSTYDTNGSITFAVDPDNPDKPVIPDNGGNGETTDKVEQEDVKTTHSYEKKDTGVSINNDKLNSNLTLPKTSALKPGGGRIALILLGVISFNLLLILIQTNKKKISLDLRGTN